MKVYELALFIMINTNISYKDVVNFLSKNLNKAMFCDDYLSEIHKKNSFKPYVFDFLYPFDKVSKIYAKNHIYTFKIRSFDENFLRLMNAAFSKNEFDFKIMKSEIYELKFDFISQVYTATPAIITISVNNKAMCYTKDFDDLNFVKTSLTSNLENKFTQFFGEKIKAPNDFIEFISIKNKFPIVFNYKNTTLLANNFKINFNCDEASQKLAKLAFAVGIGEKSSLGFGFLKKGG